MDLPQTERDLVNATEKMVQIANASLLQRVGAYQTYAKYIENGKNADEKSLANLLYAHNDRLASHLFCPTDARFGIEFEFMYNKQILLQAEQTSRVLTRAFQRHNFDLCFGSGVKVALDNGAAFLKITGKSETFERGGKTMTRIAKASSRIVPPWLIGVENEGRNGLEDQEFICETVYLNEWEVKRRISHFKDREKLWNRIKSHSTKDSGPGLPQSFMQILSASALNLSSSGSQTTPGGIVQIAGDGSNAATAPIIPQDLYAMRELWVKDDATGDYTMIQRIDPDIIISPRSDMRRVNAFCPDTLPYRMIQPNHVDGYFWGRSEIVDLMEIQGSLSETMDDFRRLMGLQYDGRYGLEGFDGDPEELMGDMRSSGYLSGRTGSKVTDLTPKVPAEAIQFIKVLREMLDDVGGFGNILSGQGEAGVRAGNHAETLMKTASPRLRDRSLIIERQYAAVGDTYLAYMQAKDDHQYYTDPEKPDETGFLLAQMPDDAQVVVDSHSSSPIYENDHRALAVDALKLGLIDAPRCLAMLNGFPDKDEAIREAREAAKQKAELVAKYPELAFKGRSHK